MHEGCGAHRAAGEPAAGGQQAEHQAQGRAQATPAAPAARIGADARVVIIGSIGPDRIQGDDLGRRQIGRAAQVERMLARFLEGVGLAIRRRAPIGFQRRCRRADQIDAALVRAIHTPAKLYRLAHLEHVPVGRLFEPVHPATGRRRIFLRCRIGQQRRESGFLRIEGGVARLPLLKHLRVVAADGDVRVRHITAHPLQRRQAELHGVAVIQYLIVDPEVLRLPVFVQRVVVGIAACHPANVVHHQVSRPATIHNACLQGLVEVQVIGFLALLDGTDVDQTHAALLPVDVRSNHLSRARAHKDLGRQAVVFGMLRGARKELALLPQQEGRHRLPDCRGHGTKTVAQFLAGFAVLVLGVQHGAFAVAQRDRAGEIGLAPELLGLQEIVEAVGTHRHDRVGADLVDVGYAIGIAVEQAGVVLGDGGAPGGRVTLQVKNWR